jgi:hypothetical protein
LEKKESTLLEERKKIFFVDIKRKNPYILPGEEEWFKRMELNFGKDWKNGVRED